MLLLSKTLRTIELGDLLTLEVRCGSSHKEDEWWYYDLYHAHTKIGGLHVTHYEKSANYPERFTIYNFVITDRARNKGYGQKLLKAVLQELKRDKLPIHLTTTYDNLKARHIYKKLGFAETLRTQGEPNYYTTCDMWYVGGNPDGQSTN